MVTGYDDAFRAGRAAWPEIDVDPARFAARLGDADPHDLQAADFYLATACLDGNPRALDAFERLHVAPVAGTLRRAGYDRALVDDALQLLRYRLLVATPEREAKLATYRGRGSLTGWLRVSALRQARALLGPRSRPHDSIGELAADPAQVELRVAMRDHGDALRRMLRAAIGELDDRGRAVLRLEVADGLPHERIAALFGVHRTTVLRWIDDARQTVARAVRRMLRAELGIGGATADSLLRSLAALEVSLGSALLR